MGRLRLGLDDERRAELRRLEVEQRLRRRIRLQYTPPDRSHRAVHERVALRVRGAIKHKEDLKALERARPPISTLPDVRHALTDPHSGVAQERVPFADDEPGADRARVTSFASCWKRTRPSEPSTWSRSRHARQSGFRYAGLDLTRSARHVAARGRPRSVPGGRHP